MCFLRLSVTASLIRQGMWFNALFLADETGSAVYSPEYFRPLEYWDRGLESHAKHVRTGCPKSRYTEAVRCSTVIIFTFVQIFICSRWWNCGYASTCFCQHVC
jgi:hypothetical protein